MTEHNTAIVLAAGKGSRMNSKIEKQFLELEGKPVICYALNEFQQAECIHEIILVTGEHQIEYCSSLVRKYGYTKVSKVIAGGKERYHSVNNGLMAIEKSDYVLIHDGARPFVNEEMFKNALDQVRISQACVVGMPVKDTIKIVDEKNQVVSTPRRDRVWMIQTPQVFAFEPIRKAYAKIIEDGVSGITDDASVWELVMDTPVTVIEGSYRNMKLTTPEDLIIAKAYLQEK